jgi:hypothetical protein
MSWVDQVKLVPIRWRATPPVAYSRVFQLASNRDWWNTRKLPSLFRWKVNIYLGYMECYSNIRHKLNMERFHNNKTYPTHLHWKTKMRSKQRWLRFAVYALASVLRDQGAFKDLMVSMSGHHSFILLLSSTWWGVVKSLQYSSKSSLLAELMALDSI